MNDNKFEYKNKYKRYIMNEEFMLSKIDEFLEKVTPEYILQKCIEYKCELEQVDLLYEEKQ